MAQAWYHSLMTAATLNTACQNWAAAMFSQASIKIDRKLQKLYL